MQTRVSPWFTWHAHYLLGTGTTVCDLACGTGRHAIAAALLGARVTAVDRDPSALAQAREAAARVGADVTFVEADLEREWPALGSFECVCVFNYLDRGRRDDLCRLVAPDGVLVMETFLVSQRAQGWGPAHEAHLLEHGELAQFVAPWPIVLGREVLEEAGGERVRAVASIVARRPIGA